MYQNSAICSCPDCRGRIWGSPWFQGVHHYHHDPLRHSHWWHAGNDPKHSTHTGHTISYPQHSWEVEMIAPLERYGKQGWEPHIGHKTDHTGGPTQLPNAWTWSIYGTSKMSPRVCQACGIKENDTMQGHILGEWPKATTAAEHLGKNVALSQNQGQRNSEGGRHCNQVGENLGAVLRVGDKRIAF